MRNATVKTSVTVEVNGFSYRVSIIETGWMPQTGQMLQMDVAYDIPSQHELAAEMEYLTLDWLERQYGYILHDRIAEQVYAQVIPPGMKNLYAITWIDHISTVNVKERRNVAGANA